MPSLLSPISQHGSISGPPVTLNPYVLGSVAGLGIIVTIFPKSDTDGLFLTHLTATFPKLEIAILITTRDCVPTITGGKNIRPGDVGYQIARSVFGNYDMNINYKCRSYNFTSV
jgi:hypothetical protein